MLGLDISGLTFRYQKVSFYRKISQNNTMITQFSGLFWQMD